MTPTAPPDTFGFMVAGYAVILVGLALYGLSLVTRFRRLDRQEKWMDELENEEGSTKREQAD
ncbi:MAG: hypothetical protein ABSG98_09105 [Anaerolineales bacterium]|jgi:hypothetical protein